MAPFLCGHRVSQTCPQCGLTFEHGVVPDLKTVYCPNCGCKFSPTTTSIAPQRVSVLPGQTPNRWDIVAFRHHGKTLIKRVVGLPGEIISIRRGNILIDGNVIVKPATVVDQTKRFVFDSAFHGPHTRGALQCDNDRWDFERPRFVHRPRPEGSCDWITYCHHPRYPTHSHVQPNLCQAIQDADSFNQNLTRSLHVVQELIVQTELSLSAGAKFKFQRLIGTTIFEVTLSADGKERNFSIKFSGNGFDRRFQKKRHADDSVVVWFSNIDQKITLKVNDETLIDIAVKNALLGDADDPVTVPFLKFGFCGTSSGSVDRCRIWRDIYYFAEARLPQHTLPMQIPDREYFVLGDNVPVSRDSRQFGTAKDLIGTVKP